MKKAVSVANDFLKREIIVETGGIRTASFANLLTGRRFPVRSEEFALHLQGGGTLTGSDFRCLSHSLSRSSKEQSFRATLLNADTGVRLCVTYSLKANDFYTRKHITVEAGNRLVRSVEVERFRTENARFRLGGFGQPVFWNDEVFLGLEYPAGYNIAHRDGNVSLMHHPGRRGTIESKTAVVGVCPDTVNNRIRDWFLRYIEANRARPVRKFHAQYGAPFHGAGADLAEEGRFFRKHGISVDTVYVHADIGWFEPKGVMLVRPEKEQKHSLRKLMKNARKELGARMGFHCNTGGGRSSGDHAWYREHFDMITTRYYCLADPRVHEQLKANLLTLVKRYGSALFSFDWLWLHTAWDCPHANHRGHIGGTKFGREAITDSFIEIARSLRAARPGMFLEDLEVEHSPWWLFHADALWSYAGEGSGLRHEYMDASVIGWSRKGAFPFSSIWYACAPPYSLFGPSEKDGYDLRTFLDAIVMGYLRGSQVEEMWHHIPNLSETYRNPYAQIILWARERQDILLANTTPVGGDPMKYRVYGYSHFREDNRGVIGLYNPAHWKDQTARVRLDEKAHFFRSGRPHAIEIAYPFRQRLPGTYRYGDTVSVPVAGGEVLVLEIAPVSRPNPKAGCTGLAAESRPFVRNARTEQGTASQASRRFRISFDLDLAEGETAFVRALADLRLEPEVVTDEDRRKMDELKNSYWTNAGKRKVVGKREIIPWNAVADGENLGIWTVLQEKTRDVFVFSASQDGKAVAMDTSFLKDFGNSQAELLSVGRHPFRRIRPILRFSGSSRVSAGHISAEIEIRWPAAVVSVWVERIRKRDTDALPSKRRCLPDTWAGQCKNIHTIVERRRI